MSLFISQTRLTFQFLKENLEERAHNISYEWIIEQIACQFFLV